MNRVKISLSLFCVLLITTNCTSPLKGRLLENQNPEYKGYVSPISISVTPEYKPARYEYELSTVAVSDKSSFEVTAKFNVETSVMGDLLLWNVKMTSMKRGSQLFSGKVPLADYRLLTNKHGKIQEMEISFPAFEQQGKQAGSQDPTWDQLREEMTKEAKQSINILNHNPVKSGDWILRNSWNEQELNFVIQGYSFHEGQKVIVAKFNDSLYVQGMMTDIRGYFLLDAQTYHWTKLEMYFSTTHQGQTVDAYAVAVAKKF